MEISVPIIAAHRAAAQAAAQAASRQATRPLPGTRPLPATPLNPSAGTLTLTAQATTSAQQPQLRYFRQHSTRRLRTVLSLSWWVGLGYAMLGLFVGGAAIWMTLDQAFFASNPEQIPWPVLLYALSLGTTGIVTTLGCVYCLSGNSMGLLILKYGERAALLYQLIASIMCAGAAVRGLWMYGINIGAFIALCVAMTCLLLGWMIVPVLLMLLADRTEVRRAFGMISEEPGRAM